MAYFTNRIQSVSVERINSSSLLLKYGVPKVFLFVCFVVVVFFVVVVVFLCFFLVGPILFTLYV